MHTIHVDAHKFAHAHTHIYNHNNATNVKSFWEEDFYEFQGFMKAANFEHETFLLIVWNTHGIAACQNNRFHMLHYVRS